MRNFHTVTSLSYLLLLLGLPVSGLSQPRYPGQILSQSTSHQTFVHPLDSSWNGELTQVPFNYQIGGSVPAAVTFNVTSTPSADLTLAINAGTWLMAGLSSNTTPSTLTISVNPSGLSVGQYLGYVEVFSEEGDLLYGVTLNVTAAAAVTVSLSSPTFLFSGVAGGAAPNSQQLSVTASTSSSATAQVTEQSCTASNWLTLSPTGSFTASPTASNFMVSANQSGLAAGTTCQGTISITAGGATQTANVTLNVSANATALSLSSSTFTFSGVAGGAAPASQQLMVTAPGSTSATAQTSEQSCTTSNWLKLSPAGAFTASQTATTFTVSVDQTGMAAGTSCQGTISMTSGSSTQTANVTLNVLAKAVLTLSSSNFNFVGVASGAAPAAQQFTVTSTSNTSATAQASEQSCSGSNWLTLSPTGAFTAGSTATSFTVSVDQTGMAAGATCQGTITMTAGLSTQTASVTLSVTAAPVIVQHPATLSLATSLTPSVVGQTVTLTGFVGPSSSTPSPGGSVQFMDGTTLLGASMVVNGQASLTTSFSIAGTHTIVANYSGDTNFSGATDQLSQLVNRLTTTLTLTSSTSTSTFGGAVLLIAQLGPAPPAGVAGPTNLVEFFDGNTVLGTTAPSGLQASLTVNSLPTGPHQITAAYTGDSNWSSARCPAVAVTVSDASTVTVLTAASDGQQLVLTAVVSGPPGYSIAAPTGSVKFVDLVSSAVLGAGALPAAGLAVGSATAAFTPSAAQMTAAVGHLIGAVYSGDGNYTASSSGSLIVPGVISATGAASPVLAPNELVSLFGSNLSDVTVQTTNLPPPGLLAGDSVFVTDSAGVQRPSSLYMVSPTQINFVIPEGTAAGTAWVTVTGSGTGVMPAQVTIASVAPALFTANGTGQGAAAAELIRVSAQGTQTTENLDGPIALGTDTVYLVLYGTGIQGRSSLAGVTVTINGQSVPALYAGPQPQYPGLDQVNLLLPAGLQGAGAVNVTVSVDGQVSNVVTLTFQ